MSAAGFTGQNGADVAALTFTAIQELFVVTGLETNTGPKGRRLGLNFIHGGGPSVGKDKQRKAAEV